MLNKLVVLSLAWSLLFIASAHADPKRKVTTETETQLSAVSYMDFLDLDKLPDGIVQWGADNHQFIYPDTESTFFFYLTGKLCSGCSLEFNGRKTDLSEDLTFKLKIPVALEPATLNFIFQDAQQQKFPYRLITIWKNVPPSMKVKIQEEGGDVIKASMGFLGELKPISFAQLYWGDSIVDSFGAQDASSLDFHFYVPPDPSQYFERWTLQVKDKNQKVVAAMTKPGRAPTILHWNNFSQTELPLGSYTYQLDLRRGDNLFPGKPNSFEITAPHPFYFTSSIGLTAIAYQEQGVPNYAETTTTFKLAYDRPLIPKWRIDLGVNGFTNVVALSSTQNVNVRFLGGNLRVGYRLPLDESPWTVRIMLGYAYSTMFVSNDAFGFRNLSLLQIYPSARRQLSDRHAVGVYLKAAPLSWGLLTFNFTQRELAAGGYYEYRLANGHPLSASIDYSNLQVVLRSIQINANTFSISVGYGF